MKTQSEIIVELANYLDMKQSHISTECGFSPSHLGYIVKGKYSITENTANKIVARFPDVNREFLLTGNGKISNNPIKHKTSDARKQFNTIETLSQRMKAQDERIEDLIKQIQLLKTEVKKIINANQA